MLNFQNQWMMSSIIGKIVNDMLIEEENKEKENKEDFAERIRNLRVIDFEWKDMQWIRKNWDKIVNHKQLIELL